MKLSDGELMNRLKAGDQSAFAELYDRTSARVFGLLIRILGHRAAAEDVLQETFWQVWSRASQYNARRSSPLAWLVLIARSRARDHLRRLGRTTSTGQGHGDVVPEPSAEIEKRESTQLAVDSLTRLPDEQRHAIRLAFYGGLTYEQIARQQEVPLGTVKTRIRRGMHRMRQMLEDNGSAEGRDHA